MYKLIIIEDEYRIRAGLSSVIDWKSLGFEVTQTFEDGEDFLRWLNVGETVDVILTDIQMPHVGGIQIAESAKKINPPPKVVFISAYERLDYALSAIENNVVGYIFKPIDPTKLTNLFHDIKADLDEEYQIREITTNYTVYRQNSLVAKEYFFSDLLINLPSIPPPPKTARTLFHILYPELSFDHCVCFHAALTLPDYRDFVDRKWQDTSADLFEALKNSIHLFSGDCEYWLTAKYNEVLIVSGVYVQPNALASEAACLATIRLETEKLTILLEHSFSTPFAVSSLDVFTGITKLADSLSAKDPYQNQNVSDINLIAQISEYIKAHIEDDLSLESLSEHFFISQSHFSRIFKRRAGMTLVAFIGREKMEHAKSLLNDPHYKIYEVAERIGYKSVPHFNRQFKEYTGMTPNEYRKK